MPKNATVDRAEDCATAWFAALERGRMTGNAALVRSALSNLRRLGVIVAFTLPDDAGDPLCPIDGGFPLV